MTGTGQQRAPVHTVGIQTDVLVGVWWHAA